MMARCGVTLNLSKRYAGTSLIFLGVFFDFVAKTARISNSTFKKLLATIGLETEFGYYIERTDLQALCSRIEYMSMLQLVFSQIHCKKSYSKGHYFFFYFQNLLQN